MATATFPDPGTAAPDGTCSAGRWACSVLLLAGMGTASLAVATDERSWPHRVDTAQGVPAPSQPQRADQGELKSLIEHYDEALERRQFQEAETAAKQRVEHLLGSGEAPVSLADALADLALAQRLSEQYEAAILNYSASVSLLEQRESMLSETLVEPLRGLGDTYMASGEAGRALPVYERALHVNHVNRGPHNLDQVDLLGAIISADVAAGLHDAALGVVDRMSALHTRRFGSGSEEMLPVLARRAELLNKLERHQDERLVYLDMVRIIEDRRGDLDVSLIEPYSAIGRTYLHEVGRVVFRSEPTGATGETFLRKAVEVAQNNPDADRLMLAQALVQLADYYTVVNAQDKARQNYRSAWAILSKDGDGHLEQRRRNLETVVPLIRPELDRYANFGYRSGAEESDRADHIEGYMVARFTVNERGRATDIEIVEEDPPEFTAMRTRIQKTLKESVYRPRYADGNPASAENQLFRHDFLYVE
ncbi:MAG TPA: hypothetical protein VFZ51_00630 [Woeseiaceae bacterium]